MEPTCEHISLYCACGHLRKAARVTSLLFDEAFRDVGLTNAQCSLLINISRFEPLSVTELAARMHMDQTTVTRNIKILEKNGLVESLKDDGDARKKLVSLTPLGTRRLDAAKPGWQRAQTFIEEKLGPERFAAFLEAMHLLTQLRDEPECSGGTPSCAPCGEKE
jgi:Transcriptional regulators